MFKFMRYLFVFAFCVGGWVLAAASLHVVKSNAPQGSWIPIQVQLVTKNELTFKDTWVDTSAWTVSDLVAHPAVKTRLEQAGYDGLVKEIAGRMQPLPEAPAATTSTPAAQQQTRSDTPTPVSTDAPKRERSIFDFGN